ncbi:hypothetical protein [uncultured Tateyamaria sp.]|uniref:hypothetical protein n=1 Tax=uncultured Tateyamaria sp. TaxID=455651 RepID=UPI002619BC60|nr:hypothetical protein [uncultured Tateyamaria sp.]
MNEVTRTYHQPASRHSTDGRAETRETGATGLNDMTYLILSAIAAALLVGLLVLPVTMPGTARLWAQADLPAPLDSTVLAQNSVSVRA